jgi:hypothetical protein
LLTFLFSVAVSYVDKPPSSSLSYPDAEPAPESILFWVNLFILFMRIGYWIHNRKPVAGLTNKQEVYDGLPASFIFARIRDSGYDMQHLN